MDNVFARRLKEVRLERGLTMEEVSERTGHVISKQSLCGLCGYEKGYRLPRTQNIRLLAKALGVPVHYFFQDQR